MPSARFIVCERSTKWAVALRRQLQAGDPRVYETRTLDDCLQTVAADPTSIVAVEATAANLEALVKWIRRLRGEFRRAAIVVLGSRGLEPSEWLLREVGALHAVFSPRDLQPVLWLVRRHLAAQKAEDESDPQSVWRQLPWGDGGTSVVHDPA